jgi:site-specific DNA recombinase
MSTAALDSIYVDHPAVITNGRVVASYERLSRAKADGTRVKVTRQVDRQAIDADEFAEDKGLGGVVHFTDNDRSASRFKTKEREAFDELCDWIRAGRVSLVIVWMLDRITRSGEEQQMFLRICAENGVRIAQTSTGTTADPGDPDQWLAMVVAGAVAENEIMKSSKRIRRAKAQAAEEGKFLGGGKRRYGYTVNMTAVMLPEAEIIREAAGRVLAGESLYSVANDLTARRIPTATPILDEDGNQVMETIVPFVERPVLRKWTGPNLGLLLQRPHLAGIMTHKGKEYPGKWTPILTVDTHRALLSLLANPSRRTSPAEAGRKYLLPGLAVCDVCGVSIKSHQANKSRNRPEGGRAYWCENGHVHRWIPDVDELVIAALLAWLRENGPDVFLAGDDPAERRAELEAELDGVKARRKASAASFAAGNVDEDDHNETMAALRVRRNEIEADLRSLAASNRVPIATLDGVIGENATRAVWDALPLDRRRSVIALCLPEIRIVSARRNPGADPVALRFATEPAVIR